MSSKPFIGSLNPVPHYNSLPCSEEVQAFINNLKSQSENQDEGQKFDDLDCWFLAVGSLRAAFLIGILCFGGRDCYEALPKDKVSQETRDKLKQELGKFEWNDKLPPFQLFKTNSTRFGKLYPQIYHSIVNKITDQEAQKVFNKIKDTYLLNRVKIRWQEFQNKHRIRRKNEEAELGRTSKTQYFLIIKTKDNTYNVGMICYDYSMQTEKSQTYNRESFSGLDNLKQEPLGNKLEINQDKSNTKETKSTSQKDLQLQKTTNNISSQGTTNNIQRRSFNASTTPTYPNINSPLNSFNIEQQPQFQQPKIDPKQITFGLRQNSYSKSQSFNSTSKPQPQPQTQQPKQQNTQNTIPFYQTNIVPQTQNQPYYQNQNQNKNQSQKQSNKSVETNSLKVPLVQNQQPQSQRVQSQQTQHQQQQPQQQYHQQNQQIYHPVPKQQPLNRHLSNRTSKPRQSQIKQVTCPCQLI